MFQHRSQKIYRRLRLIPELPGERSGYRNCNSSSDPFGVGVSHFTGTTGLLYDLREIIRKISADGSDTHCTATAPRPLTVKHAVGDFTPVLTVQNGVNEAMDGGTIASAAFIITSEADGKFVLVDEAVQAQGFVDAERHAGVISVVPGGRRQASIHEKGCSEAVVELEKPTERVANRKAFQGEASARQPFRIQRW